MTDSQLSTSTARHAHGTHHAPIGTWQPRLRRVLRLNAANCLVSGTALAVAAGPIDDVLDTGHAGWVRVVGLALLPFAALCWWVASGSLDRLRAWTLPLVAGDTSWVLGSIGTVLLGWYSGGGIVAVLAMAVAVGTFAVLQFVAWRQLRTTGRATGRATR